MPGKKKVGRNGAPAGGVPPEPSQAQASGPADVDSIIETEFDKILATIRPVLASELPDTFTGWVEDVMISTNRWGNQVIKVRINLDDGRQTIVSYPKTAWMDLMTTLKEMGFRRLSEIRGREFTWQRRFVGRLRYPRHFPVKVVRND